MAVKVRSIPKETKEVTTYLAFVILRHAFNTVKSFLDVFESSRKSKKAKGAPTHEQQDLLRAMLLFASAGLDTMVKQLVRDALPIIIKSGEAGVVKQFEKFVASELKINSIDTTLGNLNIKTLASLMVADSPKEALIKRLVDSLTAGSLQSADQLFHVTSCFGIQNREFCKDERTLRTVFDIRNKISHELDIDFSQPRRNRRSRRKEEMINYTNVLLDVATAFLHTVEDKLPKAVMQTQQESK